MRKFVPGALAGVVVAAALAAPAFAATVSVRIEGDAQTLLPRTVVTTSGQPVGKPGSPTCPGNSALDAVNVATGGNWQGVYDATFSSYSLDGLLGESHPIGGDRYWSFWVNDGYAPSGVCGVPVQNGDSLLFYSDCGTAACTSSRTSTATTRGSWNGHAAGRSPRETGRGSQQDTQRHRDRRGKQTWIGLPHRPGLISQTRV